MNKQSGKCEREIKLSLTHFDYEQLIARLPQPHGLTLQSNYFFDTPGRELGKLKLALRLRLAMSTDGDERATLTLKGPAQSEQGVTVRFEQEIPIALPVAAAILKSKQLSATQLGSLRESIPHLPTESFEQTTMFSNRRISSTVLIDEESLVFEVDASTYADQSTDYELEIELTATQSGNADLIDALYALLGEWKILVSPQHLSKFERALARRA